MDIPDALVRFVQALVDDGELWLWYESLADFSERERVGELRSVSSRIREGGEHDELAHATALLAAPGVYEAVAEAARGLRGE